jgi:hypothetical protein
LFPQSQFGRHRVQQDRFRFEASHQTFYPAFPANPRLFETAKWQTKIKAQAVLADTARANTTGDSVGCVDIMGQD